MNYYERHIGDYLKDTAHLSLLEHGVYTRLMDVYYTREGAIPASEAARLIGARSKDEREALAAVLAEYFVLVDGSHLQDRCEREIERYRDKQAKAKRSAEARWGAQRPLSDGNANASATAMRTHSEGNAPRARPQTPDTRHQSPDPSGVPTPLRSVETPDPSLRSGATGPQAAPSATRKAAKPTKEPAPSSETWAAYAEAHQARYGAEPVRNAKVNAQLAQLVQRLGAAEAPLVAAFYVGHQRADYVRSMHPVDLLLRDAEGLRTAWATGRRVTHTQAMQADRTQTNANAFAPLIAAAEGRETHDA